MAERAAELDSSEFDVVFSAAHMLRLAGGGGIQSTYLFQELQMCFFKIPYSPREFSSALLHHFMNTFLKNLIKPASHDSKCLSPEMTCIYITIQLRRVKPRRRWPELVETRGGVSKFGSHVLTRHKRIKKRGVQTSSSPSRWRKCRSDVPSFST